MVRIEERGPKNTLITREIPMEVVEYPGHQQIPLQFLNWRDGGPTPPTVLDDNMQSCALTFAAIEASETKRVVDVQQMMREATA